MSDVDTLTVGIDIDTGPLKVALDRVERSIACRAR